MSYDFSLLELNYCIILHVLETRASSAGSLKAFFADVMNLQVRERTREKIGQTSQKPKGCKLIRGQLLKWWVSPTNPWVFLLQKDQHLGWRLGVPPYPVGTAWIKFQELRGCAKRMKNNTGLQRWAPRIETNWQGIWLMKWEMYNSIIYIYIWYFCRENTKLKAFGGDIFSFHDPNCKIVWMKSKSLKNMFIRNQLENKTVMVLCSLKQSFCDINFGVWWVGNHPDWNNQFNKTPWMFEIWGWKTFRNFGHIYVAPEKGSTPDPFLKVEKNYPENLGSFVKPHWTPPNP